MGFQHTLNASQTLLAQQVGRAVATRLADSSYLLVWQDTDPSIPGSERDIYAQRIDTDGETQIGETFRVNATTAGSQQRPYAIALPDGGYVITWTSFSGATFTSTSQGDIYARRFALDGTPLAGSDQLINSVTAGNQFQSRGWYDDLTGGVVIAWSSGGGTPGGFLVGHQYELTATGLQTADTDESAGAQLDFRTVSSVTGKAGGSPTIRNGTDIANDRFALGVLVIYQDTNSVIQDEDGVVFIHTQVTPQQEQWQAIPIETSADIRSSGPFVASLTGGSQFVATWSEESESNLGHPVAKFSILNADATTLGTPVTLASDAYFPTVTQLFDGTLLFAWSDAAGLGAFARWYSGDGTALTGPIQFFASEGSETFLAPTVLPAAQGGALMVASMHEGAGPIYLDLGRPALAGYGTSGGTEFTFSAQQSNPEQVVGRAQAQRLNDGSFVMTWQDQDPSGLGIFARHYQSDGTTPIGNIFRVNVGSTGDQIRPNIVALPDNGYAITWTSVGADGNGDIYARRFANNGTPFGTNDFLVNTTATAGDQFGSRGFYNNAGTPSVSSDDEISFVWTSRSGAGGMLVGEGYQLTSGGIGPLPDGFHPSSPPGTDFSALGGTPILRNIISLSSGQVIGGFEVQFRDGGGVLHDTTGAFIVLGGNGDTSFVNMLESDPNLRTSSPVVTGLQGGSVAMTWSQENEANPGHPDAYLSIISAGALSSTGQTSFVPISVAADAFYPSVRQLLDGTVAVAWSDAIGQGVKVRLYDANGTALSGAAEVMPDVGNHVPVTPTVLPVASGGAVIFANVHDGAGALGSPFLSTGISGWETEPLGGYTPFVRIGIQGLESNLLSLETLYDNLPVIQGGDGNDTLTDVAPDRSSDFRGGGGSDTIDAGGGDDRLDGGAGADTLKGGTGNDFYVVDDAGDVVIEDAGAGSGIDTVQVSINAFALPDNFENLQFAGTGNFTGTGNSADNDIESGAGNDALDAGAGNDQLVSGAGDDTLKGGAGEDLIDGGAGGGDVALFDGAESDFTVLHIVLGKKSGFTLNGASAEDIVALTDKEGRADRMVHVEKVNIGGNEHSLTGGDALKATRERTADKYLSDDGGANAMTGTAKNEVLDGLDGDDTLKGGAGNDTLLGRGGNDTLKGEAGSDMLDGGAGSDTLDGGAGNDLYVIDVAPADSVDTIVETATGGTDTISTALTEFNMTTSVNGAAFVEILQHLGDTAFTGTGNEKANTLRGGGGNDTLDGGAGADRMEGGAGDDIYVVDRAAITTILEDGSVLTVPGDVVFEGTATSDSGGADTVRTALKSYMLGTNVENLAFTGTGNFAGTGNALNNRITGGAGNDTLNGAAGDDVLVASAGNDTFTGGAGSDTLDLSALAFSFAEKGVPGGFSVGRPDASTIVITDLDSLQKFTVKGPWGAITGDRGIESYHFSDQTVTLTDLIANTASAFGDTYTGTDANDVFDGLAGNDTINGGLGDDQLTGGAGNDTFVVDSAADVVTESVDGGSDTVQTLLTAYTLPVNVEKLVYTGAESFAGTGNAQANTLTGGAGADTLDGGTGADTLTGGAGDDTYVIDNAADRIVESVDGGTGDTIQTARVSLSLGAVNPDTLAALYANVENLIYTGGANFTGTGSAANNQITGGVGNDSLNGGAGNDTLIGGAGNDTLNGGAGDDTVVLAGLRADYVFARPSATNAGLVQINTVGTAEVDQLSGVEHIRFGDASTGELTLEDLLKNTASAFPDTFQGGDGDDTFDALGGNDTLTGGAGNDTLAGGAGNDLLDGGTGNDTLTGGAGNDTYVVDSSSDVVTEVANQGTDLVKTDLASLSLLDVSANVEKLEYTGAGDFTGTGNAAANTITGGAGNDTLDGGAGADTLIGGAGNDTYVIDNAADRIVESVDGGTGDTIQTARASLSLGAVNADTLAALYANVENLTYTGGTNFTGTGNALNNVLTGGVGNDSLSGGAGNDTLTGGLGVDTLRGGAGSDTFVFDNLAATDVIADFVGSTASASAQAAGVDHIALDDAVFTQLNWLNGALVEDQLQTVTDNAQASAGMHLVYNSNKGQLLYDADGFGTGEAEVVVAVLGSTTHPALAAADFMQV